MRKARLRHPAVRGLFWILLSLLLMLVWWALVLPPLFNGTWVEMLCGIVLTVTLTLVFLMGAWNTLVRVLEKSKQQNTPNS